MQATTLLIARHGNNFDAGDVPLRVGLKTDLPLSSSGMEQGLALGRHLKEKNLIPSKIYVTELLRTQQTAEQIKKGLGLLDIPVEVLPAFNEIDFGPDDGKPEEEVVARVGEEAMKSWEEHSLAPPGWEVDATGLRAAWYDFGEHVAREHHGEVVMIVGHGGVSRFSSILTGDSHGLENSGAEKKNLKLRTASYGHLVHTDPFWKCLEWNIRPEANTNTAVPAPQPKIA